jgi:beta-N-acetylhexosaminidase
MVFGGLVAAALVGGAGLFRRPPLQVGDEALAYAGHLLMVGFSGVSPASQSAQAVAAQIRAGQIAGVIFVKDNIGSKDQVIGLTRLFSEAAPTKVLLAIDHDGGAVQTLTATHGCARLPSALQVAATRSPDQARALYREAGRSMLALGFNLNLAPAVDLHRADNPAIGHHGRAFSSDPAEVAAYAEAFIDGFAEAGLPCALKHFPGQGMARDDSHHTLPDLLDWSEADIAPFRRLIAAGKAAAVMSGYGRLRDDEPAALSRATIGGILRDKLGFDGVALTDDLDMGAVGFGLNRARTTIQALQAGNDLLMVRNRRNVHADLPRALASWIEAALATGDLSKSDLDRSVRRVSALRQQLA